jgi:hypothetical protein
MSLTITDDQITGTDTPETARYDAAAARDGAWIVSWLPERLLDRNEAITAMTLADELAAGAIAGPQLGALVDDWARELRITATEAHQRLAARRA